jgi:amino acid transporter
MAGESVKTNGEKAISKEAGKLKRGLTLLPLFGLMYFTVSGGSFGIEPLISASGPGLALLLIIITPIIFSLPNVLMVRELSTMMPAEGGYYHWVKKAFGPFVGFMAGWNNWVVSWLDVTIYPVLAATYLGYFIPVLKNGMTLGGMELSADFLRWVVSALIIWAISALQIRGARLSGLFTNWLGVFMLTPLAIMAVMGVVVWVRNGGQAVNLPFMPDGQTFTGALSTGLFVVMWNYMGWELPSAAGDEIVEPRKTYPRAMALVLIASVATYALPVAAGLYGGAGADGRWQVWGLEASDESVGVVGDLAGTAPAEGATPDEITAYDTATADWTAKLTEWDTDPAASTGWEFPQIGHAIGKALGGAGLASLMGGLLTISAVLSMVGLFIGNSLGGTRVPFALAEDGMFPRWLVRVHNKYGTPWVAIVLCGFIFTIFSWQAFAFLVVADVFMQSLVILAEFAAMWRLRRTYPDVPRQKVPGGMLGMFLVTLGPTVVILLAIYSQIAEEGFSSIGWALAFMLLGVILYFPFRHYLKIKRNVPDVDPFVESADVEE